MRSAEEIVGELLRGRGMENGDLHRLISPDFREETHDPFLLPDCQKAVERIAHAIERREKIVLFGDYDADGIPGVALATKVLESLGASVHPIIPKRSQGYGLSSAQVEIITAAEPGLVITIDNGSVAKDEIASLSQCADVIIIDHHQLHPDKNPDTAFAHVNAQREDSHYPYSDLCACATTWKVMVALFMHLGKNWEQLKWDLDLVGISTIADMVPLTGENRVLAQFGLKVLQKTKKPGIQELLKSAGKHTEDLTEYDVGFLIGPRINAPSRMHQEEEIPGKNLPLSLLLAKDSDEAARYARRVSELNAARQDLVLSHMEEAAAQLKEQEDAPIAVVGAEHFSTGVIGLVASRMTEICKKPVFAFGMEEGQWKASVRSAGGVDLQPILQETKQIWERYGGHALAAGVTLTKGLGLADVRQALADCPSGRAIDLAQLAQSAKKNPDLNISVEEISYELAALIEQIRPFGVGFEQPHFLVSGSLQNIQSMGKSGEHARAQIAGETAVVPVVFFGIESSALPRGVVECVGTVTLNEWNGKKSLQFVGKHVFSLSD